MGDRIDTPWNAQRGPRRAADSALPAYAHLPVEDGAPDGSSWGVWGEDDRLGCLNLLTPERVVAASSLVERGVVFALDADLATPGPPLFGRAAFRHEVTGVDDGPGHDDVLHGWNTQGSSQWDGFRHVRHPVHGWYGGAPEGFHGVDAWAERGLAGRAILADVARWREDQGRPLAMDESEPITADELVATLDAQGTVPEVGDVLLIRTGWLGWYEGLDQARRDELAQGHRNPGLHPEERTAECLWDLHVAAVAADNPSLEVWPPGSVHPADELAAIRDDPARRPEIFVHQRLLPLLGVPIGELFVLDPLSDDCVAERSWEGFFTSAPLNLRLGVASPPNAVVIR
ncbi:MAG: cyclase family protein [Acidimicrobiales bacterium]